MRRCIGIDGCPAGWVAADRRAVAVGGRLRDLLNALAIVPGRDVVAIDMPVGLAETGRRECDRVAREQLGAARHSVFWTATRGAVEASVAHLPLRDAHAAASRINIANAAKGVSAQGYHLFAKIREVDALLRARPDLGDVLIEVHPELAFARWYADSRDEVDLHPMPYPKKTGLGAHDRLELIFARYGRAPFESARQHYRRRELADDDIADAYAALYSAERIAEDRHVTLPADPPPRDAHGLPIRICY